MNRQEYVLGTDPIPEWIWNKTMIFRSGDGFKFEFHGKFQDVIASAGDVLTVEGSKWWVSKNT